MQELKDEFYMQRCLQLAKLGVRNVAPNPMVGAVLVFEDKIIGEGYHKHYGKPHAEVNCIQDALQNHADKIHHSTLYVSLEPCAHYGKTPPCADLIIEHKIPKVIIGCRDSFEKVDGKGIEKLKAAGITVVIGVLEKLSIEVNKAFFTFHSKRRPYIVLKWAQTADEFIASSTNKRLMISNAITNRFVHKWRSETVAIMVGANTVMKDDPLLDNRYWFGLSPKKIIVDPNLKVNRSSRIFDQGDEVLVMNCRKDGKEGNMVYVNVDSSNFISEMMGKLYQMQIQSVLVEGGAFLLQSFIDAGLWDEARVITNQNLFINEGLSAPKLYGNLKVTETSLEQDKIIFFKNQNNSYLHAASGLL